MVIMYMMVIGIVEAMSIGGGNYVCLCIISVMVIGMIEWL